MTVARPAHPRRAVPRPFALLGVAAAAAVLATATLLSADSAPDLDAPGVVPLRVSSGHGIATGFAVPGGRVVTVAHVLDGPVTVAGRRRRVVRVDSWNDLALLAAPGGGLTRAESAATAPDIASAVNGEHVRVVRLRAGGRASLSVQVRRSIVAHVRTAGTGRARVRPALELAGPARDGPVAPGDSGAPVVTDDGGLAGVVFAASRNHPDTAYAVDASAVAQLLRRR